VVFYFYNSYRNMSDSTQEPVLQEEIPEPVVQEFEEPVDVLGEAAALVSQSFSVSAAPSISGDQSQGLNIQNNGRRGKGVEALVWDKGLESEATKWAQNLARMGKMEHSTSAQRPNQGENLFWGMASPGPYKNPYTKAAEGWMAEVKDYHGEKIGQGNLSKYGHYSKGSPSLNLTQSPN
jgi:uncharacterized protein YkwD